jgi:hypothetical protein
MKVVITYKGGYTDRHGNEHPFGSVAEFTDHLAVKLMNRGVAKLAPEPPKVEAAVKPPAQNAAKHVGKAVKKTVRQPVKKEADDG